MFYLLNVKLSLCLSLSLPYKLYSITRIVKFLCDLTRKLQIHVIIANEACK